MAEESVSVEATPNGSTGNNNSTLKMPEQYLTQNALTIVAGQIFEECNRDLQWTNCMETYKRMFKDPTISSALSYMEMKIAQADWYIKIPEGASEQTRKEAQVLSSMMNDMENTWSDFIKAAASHNRYGFAPVEKVYRRRLKENGSRFNDGYYALRCTPLVSQDSVDNWRWDRETMRHLVGLTQKVYSTNNEGEPTVFKDEEVFIPRNKFMLFRAEPQKDSPIGTSPLNTVYVAWRYKVELEKFESMSISKEIRGLPEIKLPSRYMSDDASEDEKKTYQFFQRVLSLIHKGEQSGVILPSDVDSVTQKPMFEFNVKSVMGQVAHNIDAIISRYKSEIITGILAPQLTLGQGGGGSFALAESLKDITEVVVGARLKEIRDVLNHDLIPQIYELNEWDATITPTFDFDDFRQISPDDMSKSVQRLASVGGLVFNAEVVNHLHEFYGLPKAFDDEEISIEEVREFTTPNTSRAGDGMEVGKFDGTSDKVSATDTSISNLEN